MSEQLSYYARDLIEQGQDFVIAKVVDTKGSAPRKKGAVMLMKKDGNADCGFVYRTDAEIEKDNIAIIGDVDESLHDPIVYPAAILKDAPQADSAADFYDFLILHSLV